MSSRNSLTKVGLVHLRGAVCMICIALLAGVPEATAQLAGEPVGHIAVRCLGSSDTIGSLPLLRTAAWSGRGTASTLVPGESAKIQLNGNPFVADEFKSDVNTQHDAFFVLIASGERKGSFFTVTGNDTGSVTVALNGDEFASGTIRVKIIPYWTLGTAFPDGLNASTQILLPDTTGVGTDLPPDRLYTYDTISSSWMREGVSGSQNDTILYPDNYFIVRNLGTTYRLRNEGSVLQSKFVVPLNTNAATNQDNYVAIPRPVPVSLDDSGLIASGAFSASRNSGKTDLLLFFDNSVAGFNKSPARIYSYIHDRWKRAGFAGDHGSDLVFKPGSGVIIRKSIDPDAATAFWTNPPRFGD